MKKWMFLTIAVVLVAIVALAPAVFAQGPTDGYGPGYGNRSMFNGGYGPHFVDENGDGVCDNFVDQDGDGVCDYAGTGQGRGHGFVDQDGDGVCDHAGTGQGASFVDEDGDGVCDYAGSGRQFGRQGGPMGRWAR